MGRRASSGSAGSHRAGGKTDAQRGAGAPGQRTARASAVLIGLLKRAGVDVDPARWARAAGAACAALGLAGCLESHTVKCTLTHVPEGRFTKPGRQMEVAWNGAGARSVRLGWSDHQVGDGSTAYVETSDTGFVMVRTQDAQVRDAQGVAHLREWSVIIAAGGSEAARRAREGHLTPRSAPEDETLIWTCT